ncbi:hypothetical protein GCM10029964_053190 [Kibdelosporangium lantanae]
MTETRPIDDARLREHVSEVVATAVGTPVAVVAAVPSLFDLDGFDSLAIVAVLDRLERDLGVEVPPDRILPDAFSSLDTLCDLLSHATPVTTPDAGGPR